MLRKFQITPRRFSLFISIAVVLSLAFLLKPTNSASTEAAHSLQAPPAQGTVWQVGSIVPLPKGTLIYQANSFGSHINACVPEDNWLVRVTGGPRTAEGYTWYDTSRQDLDHLPTSGTGWVAPDAPTVVCPSDGTPAPAGDTIPPVISNVSWRQDGAGRTVVMATITDNVAVAAASLWWNNQEFPMQLTGGDRYQVVVPVEPNGVVRQFRITAVDPSGNLAIWPSGGSQAERIRYTNWAGQKKNTLTVAEPANTATGSFITQHQDLFAPGPGMSFDFTRTYNSVAAALDGPLGFGWTHNYNTHLKVVDDLLLQGVVLTYADGHTANFATNGSDYTSPPGDNNTLAQEGGGFVLTQPDQIKYHFNGSGKLISVEDRNHNLIQLAYTGDNLTQITDTANRVYRLDYNGSHLTKITDVLGHTYEYTYDGNGNLSNYKNPAGGVIKYVYDGEHWVTSITDPNNHVFVTNTYDGRGRMTAQTDASGSPSSITYLDERHVTFTDNLSHIVAHTYDASLRIAEDKDANGQGIAYQYDADDNPIQITDRQGHKTIFTYDAQGNVLSRQDALNQTAVFQYNGQNDLTYTRDEAGAETTFEYDPHGNLLRLHDAEGGDTRMTYDSRGLVLTWQDANSNTIKFTYDGQGNVQTATDALNNVTTFGHDAMGRQTTMTDANGHVVRFEYDANDRVIRITDPKGKPTVFTYDAVGNLTSVTDRRGFKTTYTYNENDSLVKVTDPLNHIAKFTYDKLYHRVTSTNWRGFTTTYAYDAVYNLTTATDAKGNPTQFGYNADHNLTKITDALNQVTLFEYDPLHRVVKVTDVLGGVTQYGYDPVGRPVQVKDPKGGTTQYVYDRLGRLRQQTDALLGVTQFGYDPVGNLLSTTNARGNATQHTYDALNRLTKQISPLGNTWQLSYDAVGNIVSMVDPRGNSTAFVYDANDNAVDVTDALSGHVKSTYDEEDQPISVTNQNGNTTTTAYDPLGNIKRMTLPLGQVTAFEYDANSNLAAVTNAKGKVTRFAYDALDLPVSETNPLNFVTTYSYDKLRRLIKVTDAEGNATQYGYDALDRLIKVVDALNFSTKYDYDPLGNLTAFTDANNNRTTFDVDLLSRATRETNPLGKKWQYAYDPVGNLVQRTDANGIVSNYNFDADDRLTQITYPSGPGVKLTYDENDNLVSLMDTSGKTVFGYDKLNRLTAAQRTAGILRRTGVSYAYDPVSNRTQITYPDGKAVAYAYNANNWLTSVVDPMQGITKYDYDAVGLPTHVANPNRTWTDYTYDDANRLKKLFNGKPMASTDVISSFEYTLDKVGNRLRTVEKETRGQLITWTKDYTYDKLYRLLKAVETPSAKPYQVLTSEFTYDAVGNRLSMKTNITDRPNTPALPPAATTKYTYNKANEMIMAGAVKFDYDANGNRTSMSGPTRAINYTYDFENRLTGAQTFDVLRNKKLQPDSTLDFTYDGLGRRMQRGIVEKGIRKTESFLYDGLGYDLLAQYVDPGSPRTTYYYRDLTQILSRHEIQGQGAGLQYFHHYDALGNVSAWTNQAGQETQEYSYAPYGRPIDNNGPDNASNRTDPHNNLTWSSKPWDTETELYYFGARDYDSTTGTWIEQDPYRGRIAEPMTLHRYGYVADNPSNLIDPYGFDMGPREILFGTQANDWYTNLKLILGNPIEADASAQLDGFSQLNLVDTVSGLAKFLDNIRQGLGVIAKVSEIAKIDLRYLPRNVSELGMFRSLIPQAVEKMIVRGARTLSSKLPSEVVTVSEKVAKVDYMLTFMIAPFIELPVSVKMIEKRTEGIELTTGERIAYSVAGALDAASFGIVRGGMKAPTDLISLFPGKHENVETYNNWVDEHINAGAVADGIGTVLNAAGNAIKGVFDWVMESP